MTFDEHPRRPPHWRRDDHRVARATPHGVAWRRGSTWKPEGLCHGDDVCVPLPRDAGMMRGDRLDLAAAWRRSGQPAVHDDAARVWVLGTGAAQRSAGLASLQAPDFALPDLDGRLHRLSAHRGHKVFLATWASW
jgi:hypothetical protein